MDDRSHEGTRPKRTIHFSTNWTLKAIGQSRDMQIQILILTAALAVCATATAEPSRDELTAMLHNPTSDWSSAFTHLDHHGSSAEDFQSFQDERKTLLKLADLDAKNYAQQRPATEEYADLKMGEQHALKHNLIGYVASKYAMEFSKFLEGLDRDMGSGILDVVPPSWRHVQTSQ